MTEYPEDKTERRQDYINIKGKLDTVYTLLVGIPNSEETGIIGAIKNMRERQIIIKDSLSILHTKIDSYRDGVILLADNFKKLPCQKENVTSCEDNGKQLIIKPKNGSILKQMLGGSGITLILLIALLLLFKYLGLL